MKKIFFTLTVLFSVLTINAENYIVLWHNGTSTEMVVDSITFFIRMPEIPIFLNKHELYLNVGDEEILEDQNGRNVTWRSTNSEVATVEAGLVTAVAAGEAYIIAEANGLVDSCYVNVTDPMAYVNNFVPHNWGLFGNFEPIEGQDTIQVPTTSGDTFTCVMKQVSMYIWDDSIEYVSGTGMVGSGLMILCTVRAYVITEGQYKDYYIGSSQGFTIAPKDSMRNCSVIEGKIADDYAQVAVDYWNKAWNVSEENYDSLASVNARNAYDASVTGAVMLSYNNGFYYPYRAILTSGRFDNLYIDETDPSLGEFFAYDLTIDWFNFNNHAQFGVRGELVTDENGDYVDFKFDEPYQLSITQANYKNHDFEALEEAPRKAPAKAQQYKLIDPKHIHVGVDPLKNAKLMPRKGMKK